MLEHLSQNKGGHSFEKKITDANILHMNCIQGPMTLTYNSIWLLEI